MEIKRLGTDDILIAANILENYRDSPDNVLPSKEHINSLLENSTCYVIAALETDHPIGFALAYSFPSFQIEERIAYLYDIEVLPDHRNKGIGKQLINNLLMHLGKDGVKEIWLGTGVTNIPGQKLFTSTGAKKKEEIFFEYFYPLD